MARVECAVAIHSKGPRAFCAAASCLRAQTYAGAAVVGGADSNSITADTNTTALARRSGGRPSRISVWCLVGRDANGCRLFALPADRSTSPCRPVDLSLQDQDLLPARSRREKMRQLFGIRDIFLSQKVHPLTLHRRGNGILGDHFPPPFIIGTQVPRGTPPEVIERIFRHPIKSLEFCTLLASRARDQK